MTASDPDNSQMQPFFNTIDKIHPLVYDTWGNKIDEENCYGWACFKYARDVTHAHPKETYIRRAQCAFRDRWIVAPRRRLLSPHTSPFWPQPGGCQFPEDMPDLPSKEFDRQPLSLLDITRSWIKQAYAELRPHEAEIAGIKLVSPQSHPHYDYSDHSRPTEYNNVTPLATSETGPHELATPVGNTNGPGLRLPSIRYILAYRNI